MKRIFLLFLPLIISLSNSSFLGQVPRQLEQPKQVPSAYYEYLNDKGSVVYKNKQQNCPISMATFENGFPVVYWLDEYEQSQIQIYNSQKNWVLNRRINSQLRNINKSKCNTRVFTLKHYGLATVYGRQFDNRGVPSFQLYYQLPQENGIHLKSPKSFYIQPSVTANDIKPISLKNNSNFVVAWGVIKTVQNGSFSKASNTAQLKLQFFDYEKSVNTTTHIVQYKNRSTLIPFDVVSTFSGFSLIHSTDAFNQLQLKNFDQYGNLIDHETIKCLENSQVILQCKGRLAEDDYGNFLILTSQFKQADNGSQSWVVRKKIYNNEPKYQIIHQQQNNDSDSKIIGFSSLRTAGFATIESSKQKNHTIFTFYNSNATSWKRQQIQEQGLKAYGASISNTQFIGAIDFGKEWGLFQTQSPPIEFNSPTSLIYTTDKLDKFYSLHSIARNDNNLSVKDDVFQMRKLKIKFSVWNTKWVDDNQKQKRKIVFQNKDTEQQVGTSFSFQTNEYKTIEQIQAELDKYRIRINHGLWDQFSITQQLFLEQIGFSQKLVVMVSSPEMEGGGSLLIMWIMIAVISILILIVLICVMRRCYKVSCKKRKEQKFQNLANFPQSSIELSGGGGVHNNNNDIVYDLKQNVALDRLKSLDLTIICNGILQANPELQQSSDNFNQDDKSEYIRRFLSQNNDQFFTGLNGTDLELNEDDRVLFIVNLGGEVHQFRQVEKVRVEDILIRALKDKVDHAEEEGLYLRKYISQQN